MHPFKRHWMRHTAMVPKGFIRYQVLESLSEKPMSGSELMNDIEKRTNGHWKPSPGSIYPLLAWLQDNGYVKELPTDQNGMKRYELTDSGKALLDEERRIKKKFKREARFFCPPPFLGAWFRIPPEKTLEVRESMRKLMAAFFELGSDLEEEFSKKAIEEARKILDDAAEELEKINKKMKGKEDD